MSLNVNVVVVAGRLTRDPELRTTASGTPVCSIGLALNRRVPDGKTGEWKEEPVFLDVTVWGKRAEAFAKHHRKGSPAFFQGELRLEQWKDKDGGNRQKVVIVANEWQFVESKGDGSAKNSPEPEQERGGHRSIFSGDTPF